VKPFVSPVVPFTDSHGDQRHWVGWQEWASLPDLGYPMLRVKIDTGAKTSSLHAWEISPGGKGEDEQGRPARLLKVRLDNDPLFPGKTREIVLPLVRYCVVTDTSGRRERRPVIRTRLILGAVEKEIEVNVTNREAMKFRMILGRSALEDDFIVDVNREFLLGKPEGVRR